MTSYDRHASHDSPYRSGQHVPLVHSRHAPLTSVVTSALDSRNDLSLGEIFDGDRNLSPTANTYRPDAPTSPSDGIQMQQFSDGVAPPPPVSHSWKRIDRWLDNNYTELYDNMCEGCTQNDINELEHLLDHTLPLEVRDSLMCHDGQERGGLPSGILFGCMLLDCEEIVEEWTNWQRVGAQYLAETVALAPGPQFPAATSAYPASSAEAGPSSGSSAASTHRGASNWRANLLGRQSCIPEDTIQPRYTSPHWVPLARDWGGNCIAVDLDPGPAGRYGQIILFGRDFDVKVLVARSWAAFIASVADDFEAGKAEVVADDDDIANAGAGAAGLGDGNGVGQLWLREFRSDPRKLGLNDRPPIVPFMQILRIRAENRHGKRRSQPPKPRRPPPKNHADSFRGSSKSASKRPMASSPLSRVMEETDKVSATSPLDRSPGMAASSSSSFAQSSALAPVAINSLQGNSRNGDKPVVLLMSDSNSSGSVSPKASPAALMETGVNDLGSKLNLLSVNGAPSDPRVDLTADKEN